MMLGHVGITYGTHFCMGLPMMSELMIGHEPMDCGMGSMDDVIHQQEGVNFSIPDCCDNEYICIELDEVFSKSIPLELVAPVVSSFSAPVLYTIDLDFNIDQPIPVDISPPLPPRDVTTLHQVFII